MKRRSRLKFAGRLVTALQPWPDIFGVWPEEVIRRNRETHEPRDMEGGPTPNPYAG